MRWTAVDADKLRMGDTELYEGFANNPAEVRDMIGKGNALIVDVRDAPELAAGGKLKGAVNVSRGMLEFRADPESPYHNPDFQKGKTVVIYCGSGGRAALSGKTLKELG